MEFTSRVFTQETVAAELTRLSAAGWDLVAVFPMNASTNPRDKTAPLFCLLSRKAK